MKRILILGAGGFIGHNLVRWFKERYDCWIRAVDRKYPQFSRTLADDFWVKDLRYIDNVDTVFNRDFDEVYQFACYDDKTEILTENGWKFFEDIMNSEEKVFTLNKDGFIELQTPISFLKKEYEGDMILFKGKSINIMVTPDHKMYIKRPHRDDYEFIDAEKCFKKRISFLRSAKWKGHQEDYYYFSGVYKKEVKKVEKIKMELFLEFLGYYISEGSCCDKKDGTYKIMISNRNKKLVERIKEVVKEMGFTPYVEKCRSIIMGVSFCSYQIYSFVSQLGKSNNKYVPKNIKNLDTYYLKILFDALMKGDGTKDGRCYITTSERLCSDFQEICLKLGYSTTVAVKYPKNDKWHVRYDIYISKSKKSRLLNYPERVKYKGFVYCVEVPNHLIFVRREGRTAWCGNCEMGGSGYIFTKKNDAVIMHNSAIINLNVARRAFEVGCGKLFFSSSACVYPEFNQKDPLNPDCREETAYPAQPDSVYGWEKLFAEIMYDAFSRNYNLDIRIARFHNIFGPEGSWNDGREKAPAAICRKVAVSDSVIEIWGDGQQTRSFLYIDECLEGVRRLMDHPEPLPPLNIGSEEMVTIDELAYKVMKIAGKTLKIRHIEGPTGVRGRCSNNDLIKKLLGWAPSQPLDVGLEKTYWWIYKQIYG